VHRICCAYLERFVSAAAWMRPFCGRRIGFVYGMCSFSRRLDVTDAAPRLQAVVADPSHRENLENYAYFLNQVMNNQHEALYYYQVRVLRSPSIVAPGVLGIKCTCCVHRHYISITVN
jgi:hypothetical protein